jgi:sugar transferase EpsL
MELFQMKRIIYQRYLKRVMDFSAAFLLLIFIWPILLLIYIILRIKIGSPVMLWQERAGFKGKTFTIHKFRTMTDERDANGELLPDEQRITKIGGILRSASLDELPEIINVLMGEMSLIGPRPLHTRYLERYSSEQARRHEVMPGITGWVQINGRNNLTWEEKFALDVWYVDHQSFMLDVHILFKTVWIVLRREGISQEGYVAAEEFMGSNRKDSK